MGEKFGAADRVPVQSKIVLGGLGEFWSYRRRLVLVAFCLARCGTRVLVCPIALMSFHLAVLANLGEDLAASFQRGFRILPRVETRSRQRCKDGRLVLESFCVKLELIREPLYVFGQPGIRTNGFQ